MARTFVRGSQYYLESLSTPVTAAPFTIAIWAVISNTTQNHVLFTLEDTTVDNGWQVKAQTGTPRFRIIGAAGSNCDATVSYGANAWHHFVAREAAANDHAMFLDGGNKGTNATSRTPSSVDRINVGRKYVGGSPGEYLGGRAAEAALWNVALTDDEIAVLSGGIRPYHIRPGNLVGYWPIWGLHSPEIDLSGQGNALTVTGATAADHAPVATFTPIWVAGYPDVAVAAAVGQPVPIRTQGIPTSRRDRPGSWN